MAPIAVALGRDVPRCDITVRAVSLVIQWGPERLWNWQLVGEANLGNALGPATVLAQAIGSGQFELPELETNVPLPWIVVISARSRSTSIARRTVP
jgi:hypothetical protein